MYILCIYVYIYIYTRMESRKMGMECDSPLGNCKVGAPSRKSGEYVNTEKWEYDQQSLDICMCMYIYIYIYLYIHI